MASATIRFDDNAWTLRLTVNEDGTPVDVSGMTLADSFRLVSPKGSAKLRTPVFTTTGVDGQLQYVVVAGDFDQVGRWRALVDVSIGGGVDVKSSGFIIDVQRIGDS